MSRENVEIVRRIYDDGLIDRADEALRPLLNPEVEYVNPAEAIEPGTRSGLDEVLDAFRSTPRIFDTAAHEVHELFDAGDSVVAAVSFRARGRGSDREVTQEEAHTWTFNDGKVTRFEWCRDLASALEAVGLRTGL
jgi:ketosteroid isomerase-like protein